MDFLCVWKAFIEVEKFLKTETSSKNMKTFKYLKRQSEVDPLLCPWKFQIFTKSQELKNTRIKRSIPKINRITLDLMGAYLAIRCHRLGDTDHCLP